jgi:type I restriction enzyme R subunit
LFDVLEYIAYSRKTITRLQRVCNAEDNVYAFLNEKQRDFIGFILTNYVQDGVDELDIAKLSSVIKSKYGGIPEAERALGSIDDISKVFIEFQKHLYAEKVA